jgi:hypothetical protein
VGTNCGPQDKRVFDAPSVVTSTSEILSAYAQDRIDFTDRFNLYLGVRMDDQTHTNDADDEILSEADFAPRLAATWDTHGDGTVLIKATAGRYYQVVGQDIFTREYATQPNGTNQFTQLRWNPLTQRYDIFQQRMLAPVGLDPGEFDPYFKDEVSAGVEWQFVSTWAFKARGIWWELDDLFWSTQQFNATGAIVTDVRNWEQGKREYEGVVLELNRAFRDNWVLRTNYTWSDGNGNNFGNGDGTTDDDDFLEGLGGIECAGNPCVSTGRTGVTSINREGHGNADREHNLNVVGQKIFPVGHHNLGLGGYFGFRSGEYWGRRLQTQVRAPGGNAIITTTTYAEPRDAQQMEDTYTLNLTGWWQFPIAGSVSGRLGVEAVNVTDEQEFISINLATGQPDVGKQAIQAPRELRLQIGITF